MILRGFYGVVSLDEAPGVVEAAKRLASQLLDGGAAAVQVRMKRGSTRALVEVSRAVQALCQLHRVPFIVNDRLDVALALGADGVHLGQDDLPLELALDLVARAGAKLAVGVSTHSPAQAEAAARAGADYLGFGPVYATATKENPDPVQGISALADAVRCAAPVPVVAIGGITIDRAAEVAATGAAAACVISAVNSATDPRAAARAVAAAFVRRTSA